MASLPCERDLFDVQPMAGKAVVPTARSVRTDLPRSIAPLAGEAELLHHHLKDLLVDLLGGAA